MLKRNTMFVVGAGASADLGSPIGSTLIQDLFQDFAKRNNGETLLGSQEILSLMKFSNQSREEFAENYRAGQKLAQILSGSPLSIDNVVHTHNSDKRLGAVAKMGIAKTILEYEKSSEIAVAHGFDLRTSKVPQQNWLNFCLTRHFAGYELERISNIFENVKFISFNYDRCIRQIARIVAANYFQLNDQQTIALVENLEIIHPYGSLGKLPTDPNGGEFSFGQNFDAQRVFAMSQNIRTFTEGIADAQLQQSIHEAMGWADNIVFIGFGYIELNLKALDSAFLKGSQRTLFGSAFKVSYASSQTVARELRQRFNGANILGFDISQDATAFAREYEKDWFI